MATIAGKYEVERELGNGGYGQVLLVRHKDLGVKYALKLLNRALSDDERFIERFKREAEVLLRFSHPGSVQLRDFGKTEDGFYYIAMDYSEGKPLSAILNEQGRLGARETLNVVEQILKVLGAAHKAGVIHRDIKPDNIMIEGGDLSSPSCVKVLDFGVAKLKEQALTTTKTLEGASLGTPQYMAPEQAAGDSDFDHRVDVYAVGVLAYETFTGRVPFLGETVVQTLLMHITRPPPPFSEEIGIPLEIESVIMRALAKDRKDRYQSCEEFGIEIRRVSAIFAPALEGEKSPEHALAPVPRTETPVQITPVSRTKILCLDDNEMVLNILKHLLEREGYEVFTATNPSSIYPFLFAEKVTLLISDVQMPGLSGARVCQMLKKSLKDLKIILFSNIPERDLEKMSKESRADDFISKNLPPNEWIGRVKSVLERA